jgi:hypothetical protein
MKLSRWVLNLMTSVLIKDTTRRDPWRRGKGCVKMKAEIGEM